MARKHAASDTESDEAGSPKRARTAGSSASRDASEPNDRDVEMNGDGDVRDQSDEEEPEDEDETEEEKQRAAKHMKDMQNRKKGVGHDRIAIWTRRARTRTRASEQQMLIQHHTGNWNGWDHRAS